MKWKQYKDNLINLESKKTKQLKLKKTLYCFNVRDCGLNFARFNIKHMVVLISYFQKVNFKNTNIIKH